MRQWQSRFDKDEWRNQISCNMERVRDDDMFNVVVHDSLVNSTLYGKELSFGSSNVDGPVKCFDNRFVIGMDV